MNGSQMSELQALKEFIESSEREKIDIFYRAKLVSALMLQRRGKADIDVEQRLGIKLKPEHKKAALLGDPAKFGINLVWPKVPMIGVPDEGAYTGHVLIKTEGKSIGNEGSVWEFNAPALLHWLADHWSSLVLREAGADENMAANDNQACVDSPIRRHELTEAFTRTPVEELSIIRIGNLAHIKLDSDPGFFTQFDTLQLTLGELGNVVADRILWLTEIGVVADENSNLIQRWRNRNSISMDSIIELATKQPAHSIVGQWLKEHIDPSELVNIQRVGDQPQRLLAAARMMAPLDDGSTVEILDSLRNIQFESLGRDLYQISAEATNEYTRYISEYRDTIKPVRIGHHLAHWLRRAIGLIEDSPGNPQELLERWNVSIQEVRWRTKNIDAVACWQLNSQPVVLLNLNGIHSDNVGGRRATLAHEICHILIDRNTFLPVVEVLGGEISKKREQIARGFQAEFLVPRATARKVFSASPDVVSALRAITENFFVSQQLAANQILNAGCSLTLEERSLLETIAQR